MTKPVFTWQPGNEVWGLHYDAEGRRWRTELQGSVERVGPGCIYVTTPTGCVCRSVVGELLFPALSLAVLWTVQNPPDMPHRAASGD